MDKTNKPWHHRVMGKFRQVIFDCDGASVDSEVIANRVEAEFKTQLGYLISTGRANIEVCGAWSEIRDAPNGNEISSSELL